MENLNDFFFWPNAALIVLNIIFFIRAIVSNQNVFSKSDSGYNETLLLRLLGVFGVFELSCITIDSFFFGKFDVYFSNKTAGFIMFVILLSLAVMFLGMRAFKTKLIN